MKSQNNLLTDLLDLDTPEASQDILWFAGATQTVHILDGNVGIELDFFAQLFNEEGIAPDKNIPLKRHTLWVSAYGEEIIRLTINFNGDDLPDVKNNVMLDIHETLKQSPLSVERDSEGWKIIDPMGKVRMKIDNQSLVIKYWSDLIPAPPQALMATIFPDGQTAIP